MVTDAVCKMEVDEKTSKFSTIYKNKTYYFCSRVCKDKFDSTVNNMKKAGGGICYGVRVDDEKAIKK